MTSTTELMDDQLIFEVTSGKAFNETKGFKNYAFSNVQRVVMGRVD